MNEKRDSVMYKPGTETMTIVADGKKTKEEMQARGGHRFWFMALIIFTWVLYIVTYVVGIAIGTGALGKYQLGAIPQRFVRTV